MSDQQWTAGSGDAGYGWTSTWPQAIAPARGPRAAAALERGKVFLNGTEATLADAARRLVAGDIVRVLGRSARQRQARPRLGVARATSTIVYEDDALIVVNKPAGHALGAAGAQRRTRRRSSRRSKNASARSASAGRSSSTASIRTPRAWSSSRRIRRRSDRLQVQFARREPERVYLRRRLRTPGTGPGHVARHAGVGREGADPEGDAPARSARQRSDLHYRIVETFRDASLVEVRLRHRDAATRSGSRRGCAGTPWSANSATSIGPDALRPIAFGRQALHAFRLGFDHPDDGRPLRFEAPLPADLDELLIRLRRDSE